MLEGIIIALVGNEAEAMEVKSGKSKCSALSLSLAPVGAVQCGCHARRPLLPCPTPRRRQFIPYSPHVSLYKNVTLCAAAAAGWAGERQEGP